MNTFVVAVLLIAVSQVAYSAYTPYSATNTRQHSSGSEENEDGVNLSDFISHAKQEQGGFYGFGQDQKYGVKGGSQQQHGQRHHHQQYQDHQQQNYGSNKQNQGLGQSGHQQHGTDYFNQQQNWQHQEQHESDEYGQHNLQGGVGDKSEQSLFGHIRQNINSQKYQPYGHHTSLSEQFFGQEQDQLQQEKNMYGQQRQRVYHSGEHQQGRFVVNQQRNRNNEQDSNEGGSVKNKNTIKPIPW